MVFPAPSILGHLDWDCLTDDFGDLTLGDSVPLGHFYWQSGLRQAEIAPQNHSP